MDAFTLCTEYQGRQDKESPKYWADDHKDISENWSGFIDQHQEKSHPWLVFMSMQCVRDHTGHAFGSSVK